MKIEMKVQLSGTRNGVRWPEAGGVVDLPEGEAIALVEAGLAEPSKAKPDKAVAPKAQTADAPKPAKKKA